MRRILLLVCSFVAASMAFAQGVNFVVPARIQDKDSSILNQILRSSYYSNYQSITPIKKDQILNLSSIEVSFDMTTHLVFPYEILYVDLGSTDIVSQKADKVGNVLKMKANKRGFPPTTATVITTDGQFFSFMVSYADYPKILNINLFKNSATGNGNNIVTRYGQSVSPHTTENTAIALVGNVNMNEGEMDRLANTAMNKRRKLQHIGQEKYHMDVAVDNIFIRGNVLFFSCSFENNSEVAYDFDFVKFFIRDKKLLKRTAQQELEIEPVHVFDPKKASTIMGKGLVKKVFCFQKFTVFDDKDLYVEIFEKNGGRTFIFNLTNEDLIRAKKI